MVDFRPPQCRGITKVRRHREQALRPIDPASADNFRKGYDATLQALQKLLPRLQGAELSAPVAALQAALAAYRKGFDELATATVATEDLFAGLNTQLAALHAQTEQAMAALAKYAVAEREANAAALASTRLLQEGFAATALLLGLVLAALIGRGIARPLGAMTQAMRKLADGDTGVEIPARDGRDEIAEMAGTVDVFRRNMIDPNCIHHRMEKKCPMG